VGGDIANMNWAIAILGGVGLFGEIYWLLKGRHEYLVFGNSILDDNVLVHGHGLVNGRDAATRFGPTIDK
jgi:hypothetical protein